MVKHTEKTRRKHGEDTERCRRDADASYIGGTKKAARRGAAGRFVFGCRDYFCMVRSVLLRNTFARHGKGSELPLLI